MKPHRPFSIAKWGIRYLSNGERQSRLERTANLGTMVQILQLKVPQLLSKTPPQRIMSNNITMRVLPNQFPNFPNFHGKVSVTLGMKTIQKALTMFYLNPRCQIHITDLTIIEPMKSLSDDELINLSIDNNQIGYEGCPAQDVSQYTSKIKIKWRTCLTKCDHLMDSLTEEAKYGVFSIDKFNWSKLLKSSNPIQSLALLEAKKTLEGLSNTIKSLDPTENRDDVGRVLTGIFVFELNAANDQIVIFTIDTLEILESKDLNFNNDNTVSPI